MIEAIIAVGKKFGIKFRILPDYEIIVLFRVSFELFLEKNSKEYSKHNLSPRESMQD